MNLYYFYSQGEWAGGLTPLLIAKNASLLSGGHIVTTYQQAKKLGYDSTTQVNDYIEAKSRRKAIETFRKLLWSKHNTAQVKCFTGAALMDAVVPRNWNIEA